MSGGGKNVKAFQLLVHHHAVAHVDRSDVIWLPSFIGRWVNALAGHFGQVGLLMHQSVEHKTLQDEPVSRPNVKLYSLGSPGRMWDRIPRMRRIRAACQAASKETDGLLVRGITPRQLTVWNQLGVERKAFLLVGSVASQRRALAAAPSEGFYQNYMASHRRRELARIARSGLLLANSPDVVGEIEREFHREAFFVPTNSIRAAEIPPLEFRPLSDPVRLLFCGRVVPDKGVIELLQAVSSLKARGLDCELDIVGPLTAEMRARVSDVAEEHGVGQRVKLHGAVPYGERLFEFYRRADVLTLPTYHEGFPHVIWEAAGHSCAVVTTLVGGIPSLWKHETHGLLVPPQDAEALAQAVERIVTDEGLRRSLVSRAHAYVSGFTVEACADRLATVLAEHWRLN